MTVSNDSLDYIGDELEIFKYARNWKQYFSTSISPFIQGDVLEVGAGFGANTSSLTRLPKEITSWCLLEPDSELASQIASYTAEVDIPNKTIINGTIHSVHGQKFDTIIYIDVLEHIENSAKEIILLKQSLKPNGHLIILVPAYNFLYNNFDKKIGHFRRYDKNLLLEDINSQLSVVDMYYLDSIGFFASLLNKLVLKKELPSVGNVNLWDKYMIPTSKVMDVLFFRSFGKSLIGIFKNDITGHLGVVRKSADK